MRPDAWPSGLRNPRNRVCRYLLDTKANMTTKYLAFLIIMPQIMAYMTTRAVFSPAMDKLRREVNLRFMGPVMKKKAQAGGQAVEGEMDREAEEVEAL